MPYSHPQAENVFIPHWTTAVNPGAGNDQSVAVPDAGHIELVLLTFDFTADANPANREIEVTLETGGLSIPLTGTLEYVTASDAFHIICHQNPEFAAVATTHRMSLGLPNLRIFDNTATVDITVTNIQAGDAITSTVAYWKLWRGVG
jgi:hypothetical protein